MHYQISRWMIVKTVIRYASWHRRLLSVLGIGLILALVYPVPAASAQPQVVRHVRLPDQDDRNQYFIDLLQLALGWSDSRFVLQESAHRMHQGRALRWLQRKKELDVVWTMTSIAREQIPGLRPIRIPLQKGLIGYRLALVREADADQYCGLTDIVSLRALTAGQGHDWPDTAILRANGIDVITSTEYESHFRMLRQGRFDYFPRSAIEIWAEAERYAEDGLVVAPCFLVRYPAAVYFFVHEDNTVLAEQLEQGLLRSIEDGSFDLLFNQHYGSYLARARLETRHRLDLVNPLLPRETPLSNSIFWLFPTNR